ncbi:MAG TPA: NAD-dependent malic enzyme [Vicinamibacterales bacterium]|nr:NAD-dependent malic enzyme [Vicinamibacterales bacterium]HPW20294.1 NAD-dependent malic enzyme [Vicinamibacterales bacterium]
MKTFSMKIDPLTNEEYWEVYLRGQQILSDPLLNKASAFTQEERLSLGLTGLLRTAVSTLDRQVERSYENLQRKPDDLERYIYLQGLLDRNEVLYYRVLQEHLTELVPIVYTPTVGQACLELSHITRRYRGVYLSPDNIADIDQIFGELPSPSVNLIVVTDGERILGLGDLGSDGMGIPVGKVTLYVAAGGLHPACCLPMTLDVGTNNQRLLDDPLYLGWKHPRLDGQQYWDFIERFVLGVKRNFPEALIQWEDFAKHKAFTVLERYQDRVLSFDDDIQGTGAVAAAVVMTAARIKRRPASEERFLIAGMGQAGTGIAMNIQALLEREGLSEREARARIFALDLPGLLCEDTPGLSKWQQPFARARADVAGWALDASDRIGLLDVVRNAKPTVLVGVTAQPGLFGQDVLSAVAAYEPQPVVMALSNPTSKSECRPEDVARLTDGRGLIATGSPFGDVEWRGRTLAVSQCNNLYVFPGVGLGALVAKAAKVTRGMFMAASQALSDMVTPEQAARGQLLPPIGDIRAVSRAVAKAVAVEARDAGLGRLIDDDQYERAIARAQWEPAYAPYRPGRARG